MVSSIGWFAWNALGYSFDLSLEGQFRALDRDDAKIEPAARPHGRSITGVTIVVSGGLWRLVWPYVLSRLGFRGGSPPVESLGLPVNRLGARSNERRPLIHLGSKLHSPGLPSRPDG